MIDGTHRKRRKSAWSHLKFNISWLIIYSKKLYDESIFNMINETFYTGSFVQAPVLFLR
jgi:hypothetical protein